MIEVPEWVFIGSKSRLLFPMHKIVSGATLFVEPQESEDYKRLWHPQFNVVVLPENDRGFAYLLNQMLAYALERGYDCYFFCDDDVLGFRHRATNFAKSKQSTNLCGALAAMKDLMFSRDYAQVMMSFQGHNWFYKEPVKEIVGTWGCILNQTEKIKLINGADESLPFFVDWDLAARLLMAGFKTARYYDFMFSHKMKSQEGGAQIVYKNPQLISDTADILVKRYGSKLVRRTWKHNQVELTFSFQKLYEKFLRQSAMVR